MEGQGDLMFWSSLANIITAATAVPTAIGAVIMLFLVGKQLRQQTLAREVSSFIEIKKILDDAWEKYLKCDPPSRRFYFGQILSAIEQCCYLFNREMCGRRVEDMWRDHIIEVMTSVVRDEESLQIMKEIASGEETYEEIMKFFRRHKEAYLNHWNYLVDAGWVQQSGLR